MSDPFRHDDAAYVLGALSPAEREAFEAHLLGCAACRERVAEVADLPRLLDGVTPADVLDDAPGGVFDPGPVPDTLLPRMLRDARQRRARTRWLAAAAAGAAAAVAVVLTLLLTGSPGAQAPGAPAQAMHALVATPVHADVALTAETWGTRVTLHCRYDRAYGSPLQYAMTVRDRHGHTYPLGGWRISGGQQITYVGGAPVPPAQIASVDIVSPQGVPILRLTT